jgi:hypothetical protein
VIRDQPDGEVTLVRPNFQLTNEAVTLPIINTVPERDSAPVGGSTTVLVRGRVPSTPTSPASSNLLAARSPSAEDIDVVLNVTGPRAGAWNETLSRQDASCSMVAANKTSCSVQTDRVSVTSVRVFVAFE